MVPFSDTELLQGRPLLLLLMIFLPMTLLWAYALIDSTRAWLGWGQRSARAPLDSDSAAVILEPFTWAMLVILAGWFGALAYLMVIVLPRLSSSWRRLLYSAP